jgi:glycosyltransferase involved in cell wall biosynthesis
MATFSPNPSYFDQQITSLKQQDFADWICIVSDDASPAECRRQMEATIADDSRFICFWHNSNVGFYRNFERALQAVPSTTRFVALCDQDDIWFPEKISKLVAAMERDQRAMLAYSDMRIVDEMGRVISTTFWRNRKNIWDDIGLMLVANTVTGAASLFRRELLTVALPFPEGVGDRYHDHVLACAALATGKIVYLDQPLYDYRQHLDNVLGHAGQMGQKVRSTQTVGLDYGGMCQLFQGWLERNRIFFCNEYKSRQLLCEALVARVARVPSAVSFLFNGGIKSMLGLLELHLKSRMQGATTNGAEVDLLISLVLARLFGFYRCKK